MHRKFHTCALVTLGGGGRGGDPLFSVRIPTILSTDKISNANYLATLQSYIYIAKHIIIISTISWGMNFGLYKGVAFSRSY